MDGATPYGRSGTETRVTFVDEKVTESTFQDAVFGVGAPKTTTIKTSERTCGLAVKH